MAVVLAVGDIHAPCMRKGYIPFLQRVADKYACTRVVFIGDVVDWASISYHEKRSSLSNPVAEFKKAKRQVDSIKRAFPKADWMIGNHDALPSRQATTCGLDDFLLKPYGELWEVDWTVHDRYSTLAIDDVDYSHGETGSNRFPAALHKAKESFTSVVVGHHHSQMGVWYWANEKKRVFGLATGCGIDHDVMAMEYGRRFAAKPLLGCGVIESGQVPHSVPWLLR